MTGVVNPWRYNPDPGGAWNPLDISTPGQSVLALSAGNRIGTHVGGVATGATVRAVTGHSSGGPYYFECECLVAHNDSNGVNIGVCDLSATLLDNWSTMGANDCILASGAAVVSNPGSSVFDTGVSFNTAGIVLRVLFEPGVGIRVASGGGSFTPTLAFTPSGNWVPCMNLGYNYLGGLSGEIGSYEIATVAADFFYSVPGGAVEWG